MPSSLWAASPRSVPSLRRLLHPPSRPSRSAGPGLPSCALVPPDSQPVAGGVHQLLQTAPSNARPIVGGAHPPLCTALAVALDATAPRDEAPRLDAPAALDTPASLDARPAVVIARHPFGPAPPPQPVPPPRPGGAALPLDDCTASAALDATASPDARLAVSGTRHPLRPAPPPRSGGAALPRTCPWKLVVLALLW